MLPRGTLTREVPRSAQCHTRSKPRRESVVLPCRRWGSLEHPWRWQAVHPPLLRHNRMFRHGEPDLFKKSLLVRKRSPTSAWRPSTSSTVRAANRFRATSNLPEAVEAADAAEAADADAAESASGADGAAAAVAAGRGAFAGSVSIYRRELPLLVQSGLRGANQTAALSQPGECLPYDGDAYR